MAVQTQIQWRRGTASSWTSTNPTLAAGEVGYETDTGKYKVGNGSSVWTSLAYAGGATAVTYLFNATSGQTTFSGTDANGLTLAYTVGAEQVYLNGVLQVRGSDYTATNGTSIVLATGAITGDVLNVISYSTMSVTDTYTQAQADAKFVQQTNNFFAGKNKIINGDFGIWQRGTSFTASAYAYTADRWRTYGYGGANTTVTRQSFTAGTAPVSGYESSYFLRINATSTQILLTQPIEDVRTFAGQTVTLSFWAKAASNINVAALVIQNFGSGGSADVQTTGSNVSVTTSWTRFTTVFSVPSIAGKTIGANSYLDAGLFSGSLNVNLDIWGVQLEAGSIATPFQTATGTLAGELAACQRYLPALNSGAWLNGYSTSTTSSYYTYTFNVTPRTAPTGITATAANTFTVYNGAATSGAATAVAFDGANNNSALLRFTTTAGTPTLTLGQGSLLNAASGSILFTGCEL